MRVDSCAEIGADVVPRYLDGTLEAEEVEAFESHMVDCATCQAALREGAALRKVLREGAVRAPVAPPAPRPLRWLLPLAAAALLAALSLLRSRTGPLEQLGRLEAAPPLAVLAVRADADSVASLVERGVNAYRERRYADAYRLLAAADSLTPTETLAFYGGVSALLAGDAAGAIAVLGRCTASADSPYAPEAHLYIAKAWLTLRQADSSLTHLAAVRTGNSAITTHASALADSVKAVTR